MLRLEETDHNYYCSDSNFYKNGCLSQYDTWEEFKAGWFSGDSIDCDYNLCFRYDITEKSEPEVGFRLHLFFMLQRKGAFHPVIINTIDEKDLLEIEAFLKQTWDYHKIQWKEIAELEANEEAGQ